MIIIGITGGICSGKSTVSTILSNRGAHVIDADKLGHQAYSKGTQCLNDIVSAFGDSVLNEDGTINRRVLGTIVFSDTSQMKRLNSIVWPRIKQLIQNEISTVDKSVIVVEAAVMIEAGWQDMVTELWVVDVDRELAVSRLMNRNNLSREDSELRVDSQMSAEERKAMADRVIVNTGDRAALDDAVISAYNDTLLKYE